MRSVPRTVASGYLKLLTVVSNSDDAEPWSIGARIISALSAVSGFQELFEYCRMGLRVLKRCVIHACCLSTDKRNRAFSFAENAYDSIDGDRLFNHCYSENHKAKRIQKYNPLTCN
jgi:hypothetical protein